MENYSTNDHFYDSNQNYIDFLLYHKKGNNPTVREPLPKPNLNPSFPPLKRNTPKPRIINPDLDPIKHARIHLDELEY